MCSIPGLPTPGSQVHVVITKVEVNPSCGVVELWVNMDDGRKQSYEQMRREIQVPERRFEGTEGEPEDLCLVCVGGTWHRARIVSVQGDDCKVFLIDQGQPHNASREALAWAKSDSFVLPPEIKSCILANVLSIENNWPDNAEELLQSLPGQTFDGVVQQVLMPDRIILLDIPVVSRRMLGLGVTKQIPADELKCLALKCLALLKSETADRLAGPTQEGNLNGQLPKQEGYFYPELSTGTYVTVEVTEVTDELNVFCKLLIFSKAANSLSEQLRQRYGESPAFGEERPRTFGDLCAARGTDGKWHRSLLKQNIETESAVAKLFHVDEGRTESVPVDGIRPLLGQFLRMPVVTYRCFLAGIVKNGRDWTTDERDDLKSMLLNQSVVARFDRYEEPQNIYDVVLFAADSVCINTCFIERTGLIPFNVPVQDQHMLSSIVSSLRNKEDAQKVKNSNAVPDETTPDHRASVGVGGANETSDSDLQTTAPSEHVRPATVSVPEEQNTCEDARVSVGSRVSVKVSCLESPESFWCQTTESQDGLKRLTQDLQKHYESVNPRPRINSFCVARNPDDDMWHRAKIVANSQSPVVDVLFIDYGRTRKVPLHDVRPIDPAFLQLGGQAFRCSLIDPSNAAHPSAAEFLRFVDSGASSETALNCAVKAVRYDKEGLPTHTVGFDVASDGLREFTAWKLAQSEAGVQIPAPVPSDRYNISTHGVKIGVREKMWITSSESVDHFFCQLDRNSVLYDDMMKDISQHLSQKLSSDRPLGLGSVCLAKYTNKKWYRAQIEQNSPQLKVRFVDYGDLLAVNECDIRPFPAQACAARSTPVLAIPLGLSKVPVEIPPKVNQWFSDTVIGEEFTFSAVAFGEHGKVIVEMFEGSLNVNHIVRKMISKVRPDKETRPFNQADKQLPDRSEQTTRPKRDFFQEKDAKWANQKGDGRFKETSASYREPRSSKSTSRIPATQTAQLTLEDVPEEKQNVAASSTQSLHSEAKQPSPISCPEVNVNIWRDKKPKLPQNSTDEVFATCIVGPQFFWCQQCNTEELSKLTELAQVAGKPRQHVSLPTLEPGSPCLALFSSDNQWYRAQVVRKTDAVLSVVFVDFGNESEVDIKDVTSLPPGLREIAPQAFLCSLDGFDESSGSWDEAAHDDFYNLLVDQPLRVTVVSSDSNSEFGVPQYTVKIRCNDVDINGLMQKYWKSLNRSEDSPNKVTDQPSGQDIEILNEAPDVCGRKESCRYREPEIFKRKTATVYASCIAEPFFFWCQDTNTEALEKVSELVQEAGQTQKDRNLETLGPGSPCLALFSNDNKWYRAQVTHRVEDVFHVVFIDYGNESEVDVRNVRLLPQSLLEIAPQAILCSLKGFNKSEGSWADEVYDDFYSLLVDKSLRLTVDGPGHRSESSVPQYSVEIECDGVNVNALMKKYWKELDTDEDLAENMVSVNLNDTETQEKHDVV